MGAVAEAQHLETISATVEIDGVVCVGVAEHQFVAPLAVEICDDGAEGLIRRRTETDRGVKGAIGAAQVQDVGLAAVGVHQIHVVITIHASGSHRDRAILVGADDGASTEPAIAVVEIHSARGRPVAQGRLIDHEQKAHGIGSADLCCVWHC